MERRQFVAALAAGATVAVAGCNSNGGGGGGGGGADTSSPTAIVESWYQLTDDFSSDASTDEIVNSIDPYIHSVSPYPTIIEEQENSENSPAEDRTVANIDTEVTTEDVGESALSNEYGLGFFGVSESDIASIAEENAIVEASVEYEEDDSQMVQHVTATENGNWLLVF